MQPLPQERSSGEQAFRHAEGSRSVVERSMDLHLSPVQILKRRGEDSFCLVRPVPGEFKASRGLHSLLGVSPGGSQRSPGVR